MEIGDGHDDYCILLYAHVFHMLIYSYQIVNLKHDFFIMKGTRRRRKRRMMMLLVRGGGGGGGGCGISIMIEAY